ncbi:MAG: reverse transcriptase/maturase family protein, partial [Pseudonocardiaceae bacterium]
MIVDRCHQARVRNALEPEWEARFEPRSYGFRPGRGCADAIGSLYATLSGPRARRVWILDADLSATFDHIDHDHLLGQLGAFPARELVAKWLRAGVIESGRGFAPTEAGTPQGGVIARTLANHPETGFSRAPCVASPPPPTSVSAAHRGEASARRCGGDLPASCGASPPASPGSERARPGGDYTA